MRDGGGGRGKQNYIKAKDTMYRLESTKAVAVDFFFVLYLIHKIDRNSFIKKKPK